jgi:hypothetical protein
MLYRCEFRVLRTRLSPPGGCYSGVGRSALRLLYPARSLRVENTVDRQLLGGADPPHLV